MTGAMEILPRQPRESIESNQVSPLLLGYLNAEE